MAQWLTHIGLPQLGAAFKRMRVTGNDLPVLACNPMVLVELGVRYQHERVKVLAAMKALIRASPGRL